MRNKTGFPKALAKALAHPEWVQGGRGGAAVPPKWN
jgi:hypothetical protein